MTVTQALDKMFAPDVTLTLDSEYYVVKVESHTRLGSAFLDRRRNRLDRMLIGLPVDAIMNDSPSITFETIQP